MPNGNKASLFANVVKHARSRPAPTSPCNPRTHYSHTQSKTPSRFDASFSPPSPPRDARALGLGLGLSAVLCAWALTMYRSVNQKVHESSLQCAVAHTHTHHNQIKKKTKGERGGRRRQRKKKKRPTPCSALVVPLCSWAPPLLPQGIRDVLCSHMGREMLERGGGEGEESA